MNVATIGMILICMRILRFASSLVLLSVVGSTFLACSEPQPLPFSMQVIPEQIEDSVPGQRCVFLVAVAL